MEENRNDPDRERAADPAADPAMPGVGEWLFAVLLLAFSLSLTYCTS